MSAFVPTTNSVNGGHQNQVPPNSFNYPQLPYFAPMFNQYFASPNGYQLNPTGSIPNAFPNMQHNPAAPVNPMNTLHHQSQIPQLPVDSNTFRFLQSSQISLCNNNLKTDFIEPTSINSIQNNMLTNDLKSNSTNDSLGSGGSSPHVDENSTPSRAIKPSTKLKKEFKSPEEENAYRSRRQKNNEAARQSRIRRQHRERQLQEENDQLRQELDRWKRKYNDLLSVQKHQDEHVLTELQNL